MCLLSFIQNLPTDLPTHGVLPDAAGRRQPARGCMHAIMRWPCVYVRQQAIGGGGGRRPWGLWGRTFGLDTRYSGFGAFGCVFLSFFLLRAFLYPSIYVSATRARAAHARARLQASPSRAARRPAAAYAPFSWRRRQAGFEVASKELCEVVVIASSQANTPGERRH